MRKLSSDPSEVKYIQDACAISDPVFGKQYERLSAFRQTAYEGLGTAKDALFDLLDAVLLTPSANSFAELSLAPVFRLSAFSTGRSAVAKCTCPRAARRRV